MKTLNCLALLLLLESPKVFGAVGIQIPFGQSGNSSLGAPFATSTSSRLQQVYRNGAFPGIPPTSAFLIQGIYFRVDENATFFDEMLSSVQVNLSTTSRGPDGLSSIFSENIGSDETMVFGPGPLHLSGFAFNFSTGLMFDQPFLYNPNAGNLLLDIRNFNPSDASPLDAFAVLGDSVSIVAGRANETSGLTFTSGLATMFWVDIVPVPEPSTITLLFLGALAFGWKLRRLFKASTN